MNHLIGRKIKSPSCQTLILQIKSLTFASMRLIIILTLPCSTTLSLSSLDVPSWPPTSCRAPMISEQTPPPRLKHFFMLWITSRWIGEPWTNTSHLSVNLQANSFAASPPLSLELFFVDLHIVISFFRSTLHQHILFFPTTTTFKNVVGRVSSGYL